MSHSVLKGDESFGYHHMRIPENEYHILMKLIPELNARDAFVREQAWKEFTNSELGKSYHVGRTPQQVQRGHKNRIIVR